MQPPACWEDVQSEKTAMSRGSWEVGDRRGGTTHSVAVAMVDLESARKPRWKPCSGFDHSSHWAFSPHRLFLAFETTHLDATHHQPAMMYTGLGIPNHISTSAQQPLGPGHAHLGAHTRCMKPACCEMQESGVQKTDIYHFPNSAWLSLPTWKICLRFHH